jgi:hypothetical protein
MQTPTQARSAYCEYTLMNGANISQRIRKCVLCVSQCDDRLLNDSVLELKREREGERVSESMRESKGAE